MASDTAITQGGAEYLEVTITDELGEVSDLGGTNPVADIKNFAGAFVIQGLAVSNIVGMRLYFLIDTSDDPLNPGFVWPGGDYRIYITFSIGAETPRVGPFGFTVDAS